MRFIDPYSVGAIIEHEFDTDHLNVWAIFRFSMDQTVKPANALWIVRVDGDIEAVTVSAWQDAWTILLTVPGIAGLPSRVTLEYDGPDINLKTTWDKQWEPWGQILSRDSTPLPYGSFKGNEILFSQVAAQGIWYTISDPAITVNIINKTEFQNDQEIKILVAGAYQCHYYTTVQCSIANKHVLTAFQINGVDQAMGKSHYEFARAGEEETWGAPGQFILDVNNLISIGVSNDDGGNPTLEVHHCGLTVSQIGIT